MKIFIVAVAFIALCSGNALPNAPEDNSHYVEGESIYIGGKDLVMDLQKPVDETLLKSSNGVNFLQTRNGVITRAATGTVTGNDNIVRGNLKNAQLTVNGYDNSVQFSNAYC